MSSTRITLSLLVLLTIAPVYAGFKDTAIRALPKIGVGLSAIIPTGVSIWMEYKYQKSRSFLQKKPIDHEATAWATKVLTESKAFCPDLPLIVKTHQISRYQNAWAGYDNTVYIHKRPDTNIGIPAESQLKRVYCAIKNQHPQKERIMWPTALIGSWGLIANILYTSLNKPSTMSVAVMQCGVLAVTPMVGSMIATFGAFNKHEHSCTQQKDTFLIEHAKNSEELFTVAKALRKNEKHQERAEDFEKAAIDLRKKETALCAKEERELRAKNAKLRAQEAMMRNQKRFGLRTNSTEKSKA